MSASTTLYALVGELRRQGAADPTGRTGDAGAVARLVRFPFSFHARDTRTTAGAVVPPWDDGGTGGGRTRRRSVADRAVPLPVDAARARSGDDPQPHRLQRAPDELRPRRQGHRATCGVLRGPRCRRHRADRHRGALHPPDRLAVREADPRLPPRRDPRLPEDHRGGPPPPRADLRPDQPQRRAGQLDVLPPTCVGAERGGRPVVPRSAQGGHRCGDRRDRRRLRARRRALRRGRLRRDRAAVQPLVDRARLPVARHQPAYGRVRRVTGQPGAVAAADRRRGTRRGRHAPGPRRAHLRRRADRRRHDDRRRGRDRQDGRGLRPGGLHQHVHRRGHGEPVHDRGEHARPTRLRAVHPLGAAQGRRPARGRRRPVQGPAAGRTGARRGPLRSRRRGSGPDRRRVVRRQGTGGRHRRGAPVPQLQPGVRRADGPQPLAGLHREPAHRPRGRGADRDRGDRRAPATPTR